MRRTAIQREKSEKKVKQVKVQPSVSFCIPATTTEAVHRGRLVVPVLSTCYTNMNQKDTTR